VTNKVAIAFLTKDRVELSKRSIEPLLQPDELDLWWIDGSTAAAAVDFPCSYGTDNFELRSNVVGGADPAAVYALTEMLKHDYTHVGFVENDVLLHPDWFGPTMALFERGAAEGLAVGAASARCYQDRILFQRDGFAVCHNLGWGQVVFSRRAAELTLRHYRTHWTTENRRVFARLSGIDIGAYWAFRANEHFTTPDWGNDAVLASHGLSSLALVPSLVEMIGQQPSLAEQGLTLATAPVEDRRNDDAFLRFMSNTDDIRNGDLSLGVPPVRYRDDSGVEYVFAHQLDGLPHARWDGDWRLRWSPGLGGFAARGLIIPNAGFEACISGSCRFMVGGGAKGGQIAVEDLKSKYVARPTLLPEASNQVTQVVVPASVSWRPVRLTVLSGEAVLFGIQCQEPQPVVTDWKFDHSKLWSV
jgi:hypothetical protein